MSKIDLLSRRAAVARIGAAALTTGGLATAARAQTYKPQDQVKLTKAAAHYQESPMNNESCGSCPYFVQPKSCVTVQGDISPTGWCPMYTQFSPFDRGAHCAGAKSC
jgi:hypothetical protein